MINKTLGGRYRVGRTIGRGGMGLVLEADDATLGRKVALKMLKEEIAEDPTTIERFRREARIAASLSHPGIAHVYDFAEEDGESFIVMELLDGKDLHQVIQEEGKIIPERAAEIAARVAEALDHAHTRGAVHRDVKPGNIFITASGDVKVTDFGIAQAAGSAPLTMTGSFLGTPTYLAPEQINGGKAGPESDVYSLGCVLFEMVTGRPPYEAEGALGTAMAHTNSPVPSASELEPDVGPELDKVIRRALQKDPAHRFGSAGQMADALAKVPGVAPAAGTATIKIDSAPPPTLVAGASPVTAESKKPTRADEVVLPIAGPTPKRPLMIVGALIVLLAVLALTVRSCASTKGGSGGPGQATVALPNMAGKPLPEAKAELERLGFAPVEAGSERSELAAGTVVRQDPAPGNFPKGQKVSLIVSNGEGVKIPALVGLKREDAEKLLSESDLKMEIAGVEDRGEEGTILSQDPPEGTVVAKESTVRVTVSQQQGEGKGGGKGKGDDD